MRFVFVNVGITMALPAKEISWAEPTKTKFFVSSFVVPYGQWSHIHIHTGCVPRTNLSVGIRASPHMEEDRSSSETLMIGI